MIYFILITGLIITGFYVMHRAILKEANFIEILDKLQDELNGMHSQIESLEDFSHPPVAPGGATELQDQIHELQKRIERVETNSNINI